MEKHLDVLGKRDGHKVANVVYKCQIVYTSCTFKYFNCTGVQKYLQMKDKAKNVNDHHF